jgi:hypothetical protein
VRCRPNLAQKTRKKIELTVPKADGTEVHATLLRSPEWICQSRCEEAGEIEVAIGEIARGKAHIDKISP